MLFDKLLKKKENNQNKSNCFFFLLFIYIFHDESLGQRINLINNSTVSVEVKHKEEEKKSIPEKSYLKFTET